MPEELKMKDGNELTRITTGNRVTISPHHLKYLDAGKGDYLLTREGTDGNGKRCLHVYPVDIDFRPKSSAGKNGDEEKEKPSA